MKKLMFPLAAILIIGLAAVSQKQLKPASFYAQENNKFAFDVYQKITESNTGNVFISPYSISSALAMTFAGANGTTKDEMQKTMRFEDNTPDFHFGFGEYSQELLQNAKGNVQLEIANRLWGEKTYILNPDFVSLTAKAYNAPVTPINFKSQPDASRVEINNWVAANTNDRIQDLLPPGSITTDSRLVLTNAIFFKGDWLYQFKEKDTKDQKFYFSKNESKKTPFMHFAGGLNYFENESYKMLRLPYVGEKQSMVIVLPKDANELTAVEKGMNTQKFSAVFYDYKPEVILALPKFKMTLSLALKPYLIDLGMKKAFGFGADFSKMSPDNDLYISSVVHKAFIEIDEIGSEAAAATAVVMTIESISPTPKPKPIEFIADHPFLFYIIDNETNGILFMGRVSDPTSI